MQVRFFAPLRMTLGGENTACIHVYSPTSIPFHSSLFVFPLLRWLPPGGSWRRQATEGEYATLSLREHIVRRLLPPLTRSPSLPEGGEHSEHITFCASKNLGGE